MAERATPKHVGAIEYALLRLTTELAPELTYHNLSHTLEEIMPTVLCLADVCGLSLQERHLLQVAAAYHDIGFIDTYAEHEQAGIFIMAQILPKFGYEREDIDRLAHLVLATRLPQSPANRLEELLADADLGVLGMDEFMERNEALRQEISIYREPVSRRTWLEEQVAFLKSHTYFTPEAEALLGAGKERNIVRLSEALENDYA